MIGPEVLSELLGVDLTRIERVEFPRSELKRINLRENAMKSKRESRDFSNYHKS